MITTGQAICYRALRLINVLGQGQTPNPDTLEDMWQTLLNLVDTWKTNEYTMLYYSRNLFNMVSGQTLYTLGTGGNFNHARPNDVYKASIISQPSSSNPLELPITILYTNQWQGVGVKSTQSQLPYEVYIEKTYPRMNLRFYPVYTGSPIQVALYLPEEFTQFATKTTEYDIPPGFKAALEYNIAVEGAPLYAAEPSETVIRVAREKFMDLQVNNIKPETVPVDSALVRRGDRWNYLTGEFTK